MQDLIGSWTAWEIHNQYSLMICSFAFYQSSYSWQAEGAARKYVDLNSSEFAIKKKKPDILIWKSDTAIYVEGVCMYMCRCALSCCEIIINYHSIVAISIPIIPQKVCLCLRKSTTKYKFLNSPRCFTMFLSHCISHSVMPSQYLIWNMHIVLFLYPFK